MRPRGLLLLLLCTSQGTSVQSGALNSEAVHPEPALASRAEPDPQTGPWRSEGSGAIGDLGPGLDGPASEEDPAHIAEPVPPGNEEQLRGMGSLTTTGGLRTWLEYDLARPYGLNPAEGVPPEVLQSVVRGAEQGNKDSLYFLGLLKLYGIGVTPDISKAASLVRRAAEQRHPEAMSALGVMLLHGQGGSRDPRAALAWFQSAAQEGHLDAMWLLGRMHYEGKGVSEPDFSKAAEWFRRAALQGSPSGQHYMGVLHEYGLGVERDDRLAVEWHHMAASQDEPNSHYHLGLMAAHGRGRAQDFGEAAICFQKGAELRHAPSMFYLGKMCLYGHGFPVDYDLALLWFERAAAEGDPRISPKAAAARDELRFSIQEARRVNGELASAYDYGLLEETTIG